MATQTVSIEKIVHGGYGLAHLPSGQIVLVNQVLPGETVTVSVRRGKKNYLIGTPVEVVKPHPDRIDPPCPYYGRCGGCDLQHTDYATQLTVKKDILADLFQRRSEFLPPDIQDKICPVSGSPEQFHYRQRIRLQVNENGQLGFNRYRSHEIIAVDSCLLAPDAIVETVYRIQQNQQGRDLVGLSTEVELLLNPATGSTVCIFKFKRRIRPADKNRAVTLCKAVDCVERIFFTGADFPIQGPFGDATTLAHNHLSVIYPDFFESGKELQLNWEVGGFCQVNLNQNRQMIKEVINLADLSGRDTVLDLYCGMGNFAIALGQTAQHITGIEGQGSAIRSAGKNAEVADITNCTFIKSPVHQGCRSLIEDGARFDCVIIDPPRQGAPDLSAELGRLTRDKLIYVSCDPATLCRDLENLCAKGFSVTTVQPIDMFPQTHHIETIVLLQR
ncbi:23S rRNA (uracil(1939)-C(5))-methyltransferase RlmD [Desulforhopalus singaporensis]|uniref:23S rRNA m(5)U-1939 methyltransferase n=1 Tax=Desulforhopalus singaporensis TaxID=91360 RepID=A0A1H0J6I4_9BACT|nr:23S rRNA (uracil(1939)-C(5))-methyltransferase RlmD [Desulforhopalus singaporensis]SDO39099.1 23S rRNA m(5)U-1939 methyltransferase [Desulforhopalus singaporensis]